MNLIQWWLYGRREFMQEQDELERLRQKGHDIGMLPGGILIHYSICECKAADPANERQTSRKLALAHPNSEMEK